MTKKARSMKGEEVDFDLLDIKAKMQKADKPLEVKTREDFVHMKRRRRGSARFDDLLRKSAKPEVKTDSKKIKDTTTKAEKTPPPSPSEEVQDEKPVEKTTRKTKRKIVKKDS